MQAGEAVAAIGVAVAGLSASCPFQTADASRLPVSDV